MKVYFFMFSTVGRLYVKIKTHRFVTYHSHLTAEEHFLFRDDYGILSVIVAIMHACVPKLD